MILAIFVSSTVVFSVIVGISSFEARLFFLLFILLVMIVFFYILINLRYRFE